MKRRILNVIETLGRGGAEHLLVTSHCHLDRTRFEPTVVTLFGPNPLVRDLQRLRVPVHEFGLRGPQELPRAIRRLRHLIRKEKFHVVHTHLYYANVAGRLAAWRSARVLTTLHNPDYTFEDPGTWVFRAKKLLDRVTGTWLDVTHVAVSEEVKRDVQQHLKFSNVNVVSNYIDVDAFQKRLHEVNRRSVREQLRIAKDDVAILHVGRLHEQKGQDVLLEAVGLARRRGAGLVCLLVGAGRLRPALERKALEEGLKDVVRFVGSVEDVIPYYRAADLFAFPSRYEAFGIALLEAMAAGLPSVVSRTGGIGEVASDEEAIFVPVGEARSFARAVLSLIADPERRRRLGTAAQARARRFDVHIGLPQIEALYATL